MARGKWSWSVVGAALLLYGFIGFWLLGSGALLWSGISELRHGFTRVDVSVRCEVGVPEPCMSEQWARVESTDPDGLVSLTYDDGRFSWETVLLGDASPESGTRLLLEHWGDDPVSLYDPAREVRYRTEWWPQRWSAYGLGATIAGGLFFGALLSLFAIGILIRLLPSSRFAAWWMGNVTKLETQAPR